MMKLGNWSHLMMMEFIISNQLKNIGIFNIIMAQIV